MDFWKLFFKGDRSATMAVTESSSDEPSAVEYVEWLLKHMLRRSKTTLTIDTKRRLPRCDEAIGEDSPPCLPSPESVVNRLKVLCGINPVTHRQVVRGEFTRPRSHHVVIVSAEFQDAPDASTCALHLRIRSRTS
jgi:predicted GIY-YIG superfamily endonuclease